MYRALLQIEAGYASETKRQLIERVSRAMADTLALPARVLHVRLEECPAATAREPGGGATVAASGPITEPTAEEVAVATAKLLSN